MVLGEQEDDEQLRQDCGDSCSEEEDFSMEVAHHGSESLGDGEGEEHVGSRQGGRSSLDITAKA